MTAIDQRPIVYYVDRPAILQKVPILVLVDGSGCIGQRRNGLNTLWPPEPGDDRPYARLMVEKPGVAPDAADYSSRCTEEFYKHYTMDNRVRDHLRVFQHVRANADWWNGEILLWGWSDGGEIAAQLVVYHPNITRAVLGAMGGGYSMAEHFEDFWVCRPDRTNDREACVASIRKQFDEMEDNPTWKNTWSGEQNSWRVWATRLRSRMSAPLSDNRTPILIVHGALDQESTPVESARKLVADLRSADNDAFTYWEVPGMEHSWSTLSENRRMALEAAMLDWLLAGEVQPSDLKEILGESGLVGS